MPSQLSYGTHLFFTLRCVTVIPLQKRKAPKRILKEREGYIEEEGNPLHFRFI